MYAKGQGWQEEVRIRKSLGFMQKILGPKVSTIIYVFSNEKGFLVNELFRSPRKLNILTIHLTKIHIYIHLIYRSQDFGVFWIAWSRNRLRQAAAHFAGNIFWSKYQKNDNSGLEHREWNQLSLRKHSRHPRMVFSVFLVSAQLFPFFITQNGRFTWNAERRLWRGTTTYAKNVAEGKKTWPNKWIDFPWAMAYVIWTYR